MCVLPLCLRFCRHIGTRYKKDGAVVPNAEPRSQQYTSYACVLHVCPCVRVCTDPCCTVARCFLLQPESFSPAAAAAVGGKSMLFRTLVSLCLEV